MSNLSKLSPRKPVIVDQTPLIETPSLFSSDGWKHIKAHQTTQKLQQHKKKDSRYMLDYIGGMQQGAGI